LIGGHIENFGNFNKIVTAQVEVQKCPHNSTECLKSGYKTLSNNIHEFFQINDMPMPIDALRIDDGDGNGITLINHHAKYHEACRLIFNNTKLQRVQRDDVRLKSVLLTKVPRSHLRGKQLALQKDRKSTLDK
jgi:hypothetical protein